MFLMQMLCQDKSRWDHCTLNAWEVAKVLHQQYKDIVRYIDKNTWEYLDTNDGLWKKDNKYLSNIKKLFILNSRFQIAERCVEINNSTDDDICYDITRLIALSNYLSKHFTTIINEAREFFAIT
jgi:hypothetical protein